MNLSRPQCAYCHAAAVWHVRAQWSLFDFDDEVSCAEHTHQLIISFARKWVDDEPVRELLVDYCGPRGES